MEALTWTAWLLPERAQATERQATLAAGAALRDPGAAPATPQQSLALAHGLAARVAAEVAHCSLPASGTAGGAGAPALTAGSTAAGVRRLAAPAPPAKRQAPADKPPSPAQLCKRFSAAAQAARGRSAPAQQAAPAEAGAGAAPADDVLAQAAATVGSALGGLGGAFNWFKPQVAGA